MAKYFLRGLITSGLLLSSGLSMAEGFGINATRLIYPSDQKSITVTLHNSRPNVSYLAQATVSTQRDKRVDAPFNVLPNLVRLEPKKTQSLRISFAGGKLPENQESLFYFHAKAIPGSAVPLLEADNTRFTVRNPMAVGHTIKMFYRPTKLTSTSEEAQKNLQFSQARDGIKVNNESPYYVNLLRLKINGKELKIAEAEKKMLAPFSSEIYPSSQKQGSVNWETINDMGGLSAFTGSVGLIDKNKK